MYSRLLMRNFRRISKLLCIRGHSFKHRTQIVGLEPTYRHLTVTDGLANRSLTSQGYICKIGGAETIKSPPIQFSIFIFCLNPPYPQCLIVLRVYYHNIYSSCRYGFRRTSCLVGSALYENPNIQPHFLKTAFMDFSVMAIRSTS